MEKQRFLQFLDRTWHKSWTRTHHGSRRGHLGNGAGAWHEEVGMENSPEFGILSGLEVGIGVRLAMILYVDWAGTGQRN